MSSMTIPNMEKVIDLRESRRVSQRELAESLGTSQAYLSNIERKNRLLRFDLLFKFAAYFEVSVESLIIESNLGDFKPGSVQLSDARRFDSEYKNWKITGEDPSITKTKEKTKKRRIENKRTFILDEKIYREIELISIFEFREVDNQIRKFLTEAINSYHTAHGGHDSFHEKAKNVIYAFAEITEDFLPEMNEDPDNETANQET
jgi:transcriptional regulator with XRE-family HTH domain